VIAGPRVEGGRGHFVDERHRHTEASEVDALEIVTATIARVDADVVESLPPYNSIWYTQQGRKTASLAPVPYENLSHDINARLPSRVYFI